MIRATGLVPLLERFFAPMSTMAHQSHSRYIAMAHELTLFATWAIEHPSF